MRKLSYEAKKHQYSRDTYEKVIRLMDVLKYIRSEPLLFEHLALKGGTAINLTIFDLPRLSVDIDLDFTRNCRREEMMCIRKKIKQLLSDYLTKNDYRMDEDSRFHHALDSFKAIYVNAGNNKDSIKIEINYMLRSHIYEPILIRSRNYGFIQDIEIKTLDPREIFGSKLVALMTRATPRDLYDFYNMIHSSLFDEEKINEVKKRAVFYRAISNQNGKFNFDLGCLDSITQNQIKRFLVPVIHSKEFFSLSEVRKSVIEYFEKYFSLNENEKQFLDCFEKKEYKPELLLSNEELDRVKNHPMALWKTRK